jgi:hypothetical protein
MMDREVFQQIGIGGCRALPGFGHAPGKPKNVW